jgi:hypothetical protein
MTDIEFNCVESSSYVNSSELADVIDLSDICCAPTTTMSRHHNLSSNSGRSDKGDMNANVIDKL